MAVPVDRERVEELVAGGAQLVEVLPRAEFDDEHLPGAVSLPLGQLTRAPAEARLVRGSPVVVYCWDGL
ncbi:MAG: rhodanese-like domain-containing protein [Acidimicrobiales bacterium]